MAGKKFSRGWQDVIGKRVGLEAGGHDRRRNDGRRAAIGPCRPDGIPRNGHDVVCEGEPEHRRIEPVVVDDHDPVA